VLSLQARSSGFASVLTFLIAMQSRLAKARSGRTRALSHCQSIFNVHDLRSVTTLLKKGAAVWPRGMQANFVSKGECNEEQ
jgi:hypothetical protein